MADGLINTPVFVQHGDADQAVKVDYSRWGVRLLQRWGYDVRYREYPGRIHEALEWQNPDSSIPWLLQHTRNPDPVHVRIRSAEPRHASSHWVRVEQAASPMEFMVVDAERIGANQIRLDTQNVMEITLSPGAALVDPERPLKVVWNGVAREGRLSQGRLTLSAPGHAPTALHKHSQLPGALDDFTSTPFALVVGTISKDPDMVSLCQEKARAFVGFWQDWQKQMPRVFKDTEISQADMAKYSLLLLGGPDANQVAARMADRLPIRISPERITLDGHAFPVKDAAVQMLYPNPVNPQRYVLLAAGTSTDGMYFCNPLDGGIEDFRIVDGRVPVQGQIVSPLAMQIGSGMFDPSWRFSESLLLKGDEEARAKGRLLKRPKAVMLNVKVLEAFLGRYQLEQGPVLELYLDGQRLMVKGGGGIPVEMIPESATEFFIKEASVRLKVLRDAAGKFTGFEGTDSNRTFIAKRIE